MEFLIVKLSKCKKGLNTYISFNSKIPLSCYLKEIQMKARLITMERKKERERRNGKDLSKRFFLKQGESELKI